jgi:hypothetical protein
LRKSAFSDEGDLGRGKSFYPEFGMIPQKGKINVKVAPRCAHDDAFEFFFHVSRS